MNAVEVLVPRICRIVQYRSRTGDYTLPAIITATQDTLGDPRTNGLSGVPGLSSPLHVHLTVLSPGIPTGQPLRVRDARAMPSEPRLEPNTGGTYPEWDVPYDRIPEGEEQLPGTWTYPTWPYMPSDQFITVENPSRPVRPRPFDADAIADAVIAP